MKRSILNLELKQLVALMVLLMITWVVYLPVRNHEFVNYDDNLYVTDNPQVKTGLNSHSFRWSLTAVVAALWHPATLWSHLLDYELFGDNPAGHHLTSVFFHLSNVFLLCLLLYRLTGSFNRSLAVAMLFALHPYNVDSVAWISERKNVISTLFFFLTVLAYQSYCKKRSILGYLSVMAFFILGLMSKPMLVTLPCVLLLLDFWPLKRTRFFRNEEIDNKQAGKIKGKEGTGNTSELSIQWLVLEKLPMFVLSLVISFVTVQAQSSAIGSIRSVTPGTRLANAVVAYATYLWKTVWPVEFAVFYPHPYDTLKPMVILVSVIVLIALTVVAIRCMQSQPWILMGWLWFLGTLVPVIGIVQVGSQAMADRYAYLPLIGIFILLVWSISYGRWSPRLHPRLAALSMVILAMALAYGSRNQLSHWKNSVTLFSHALKVTEKNHVAHNNLGAALTVRGEVDEAINHFHMALELYPEFGDAHHFLGKALVKKGNFPEAIRHFREAIRLTGSSAAVHGDLGMAFLDSGMVQEAIPELEKAVQFNPNDPYVINNLGTALAQSGQSTAALMAFEKAIELLPFYSIAHENMGITLELTGRRNEAISAFNEALKLTAEPVDQARVLNRLGNVYLGMKNYPAAIEYYQKALEIYPQHEKARLNLELVLQKTQNP